jgi:hypothetical protein
MIFKLLAFYARTNTPFLKAFAFPKECFPMDRIPELTRIDIETVASYFGFYIEKRDDIILLKVSDYSLSILHNGYDWSRNYSPDLVDFTRPIFRLDNGDSLVEGSLLGDLVMDCFLKILQNDSKTPLGKIFEFLAESWAKDEVLSNPTVLNEDSEENTLISNDSYQVVCATESTRIWKRNVMTILTPSKVKAEVEKVVDVVKECNDERNHIILFIAWDVSEEFEMNEKGYFFLDTTKNTSLFTYPLNGSFQIIILGEQQLEKMLGEETMDILFLLKSEDRNAIAHYLKGFESDLAIEQARKKKKYQDHYLS